jgi:predicted PurR-regulated permease PerM
MVFLAAVLPLVGGIVILLKEADRLIPTVRSLLENAQRINLEMIKDKVPPFLQFLIEPLTDFFQTLDVSPESVVLKYAAALGRRITSLGALFARNALFAFINGILMIIMLFFAFRDGEKLSQWFLSLVPLESGHKSALAKRGYETFMAVVMGVFLTSSAQGLTAMFGFWLAGVKLPVLLGFATAVMALLGVSFLVTLPVGLIMLRESVPWGIFLLIWGAVVVGLLDNILKPLLIGSRARMPFMLIFFSIIGGIKTYGVLGLVLGPVMVASFLTFVEIYRQSYEMRVSGSETPEKDG